MVGSLEPSAEIDRGAERLLRLTRFLSAAFEVFEQRIAATGSGRRARAARAADRAAGPVGNRATGSDPGTGTGSDPSRRITHFPVGPGRPLPPRRRHRPRPGGRPARAVARRLRPARADARPRAARHHRDGARARRRIPSAHSRRAARHRGRARRNARAASGAVGARAGRRERRPGWFVCRDREEELVEIARAIKRDGRRRPSAASSAPPSSFSVRSRISISRARCFRTPRCPTRRSTRCRWPPSRSRRRSTWSSRSRLRKGPARRIVELLASPHWRFEADGNVGRRDRDVAAAERCCATSSISAAGIGSSSLAAGDAAATRPRAAGRQRPCARRPRPGPSCAR